MPERQSLLLFPSEDAIELNPERSAQWSQAPDSDRARRKLAASTQGSRNASSASKVSRGSSSRLARRRAIGCARSPTSIAYPRSKRLRGRLDSWSLPRARHVTSWPWAPAGRSRSARARGAVRTPHRAHALVSRNHPDRGVPLSDSARSVRGVSSRGQPRRRKSKAMLAERRAEARAQSTFVKLD